MKIPRIAVITVFLCWIPMQLVYCQNEMGRLQKVMRDYRRMKSFSMDITAVAYKSEKDVKGKQIMQGSLKMNGNKYYARMDGIEMIVKETEMLVVDHQAKEIVLGKSKSIDMLRSEQPIFNLDSLVAAGSKVVFVGKRNGNSVFAFKMDNQVLKEIELYISEDNLITKMAYFYNSTPELKSAYYKTEIRFNNINLSPPPEESFNEKKFIANKKAKAPAPAYRNYSVNVVDYSKKFGYSAPR